MKIIQLRASYKKTRDYKTHVVNIMVTLYNTGALICINSCLSNAQIIMS